MDMNNVERNGTENISCSQDETFSSKLYNGEFVLSIL